MPAPGLTSDYDYELPPELIARQPPPQRGASRMMVIDRTAGSIRHARFGEFAGLVGSEFLCVLNNTRVVPARFFTDDGRVELLRLGEPEAGAWRCLVKPGRRARPGSTLTVAGHTGVVEEVFPEDGARLIRWPEGAPDPETSGKLALPHYIGRDEQKEDRESYQTVYASEPGAIAAPTAGLHFTPDVLAALDKEWITLHVGIGTFRPVTAERIEDHRMHAERFHVTPKATRAIADAPRVLAVGTTVVRVLEHLMAAGGGIAPGHGETSIFIRPPHAFRRVDALLTNFHLPKSTLLMLVSAFAGRDLVLEAYAKAVEERYRFFSYGDCMLIL